MRLIVCPASSTSIDVTMRGVGAHGSAPQLSKDPVLMAAEFVVLAQSIVARQVDPQQPAVLTVGTIHGGTKRNIIPEEVTMGSWLTSFAKPGTPSQSAWANTRMALRPGVSTC